MPQFLLELLSEEIPARMQAAAATQLERLARETLTAADLAFESLQAFAGPRRLTLVVDGLPPVQPRRTMERKGPRLGAPEAALAGFLRSAGEGAIPFAKDGFNFATWEVGGERTSEALGQIARAIVTDFAWPKTMTWAGGSLRWVRPLRRVLCVFDGKVAPLELDGLVAADLSEGHRFMGSARLFRARDFDEYREALAGHFVVLSAAEREQRILGGARALCAERGLELVEDSGLLAEVAGMTEWPVPLLGDMDSRFLDLPPEVVRTSMRVHQRYFSVLGAGGLARFVVVANIEAPDGGRMVALGAARVLSARLEDARFFWAQDRKVKLEGWLEKLAGVVFHDRLGTMRDRALRLESAARAMAPMVGADPTSAALAGRLAKADLVSAMVAEFPELQGVMGGHYARAEGLGEDIATAIAEHYRPLGPADQAPSAPLSLAVALADKMDTIVAFFSIGEKPTGSKDPYALRRAALGVIRMVLDNRLRAPIGALARIVGAEEDQVDAINAFFADRFQVVLRERGVRHDVIEAAFALGDDDLTRVTNKIAALAAFLAEPEGSDLLAGYRRAGDVLEAEGRKGPLPEGEPTGGKSGPPEEAALRAVVEAVGGQLAADLAHEDFAAAMRALARLRAPVDAFFDKVLVNSEAPGERDERLRLLAKVRGTMAQLADFSRIAEPRRGA